MHKVMVEKGTTILIRNGTRERLKKTGYKGQTYDELINKLLDLKNKIHLFDSRAESLKSNKSSGP